MASDKNITYRGIRYRLLPGNSTTAMQLAGIAGACRFVWNHFLSENKRQYRLSQNVWVRGLPQYSRPDVSKFSLGKKFTELRHSADFPWLMDYPANVVKQSVYDLGDAWLAFFRERRKGNDEWGPPRKKSRHHDKAFTIDKASGVRIEGNRHQRLNIPRVGKLRLKGSNPYQGAEPVQAVVSQERGKWYCVVTYAVPIAMIEKANPANEVVGVDRGVAKPARVQ